MNTRSMISKSVQGKCVLSVSMKKHYTNQVLHYFVLYVIENEVCIMVSPKSLKKF
jgi:hypothetical protein